MREACGGQTKVAAAGAAAGAAANGEKGAAAGAVANGEEGAAAGAVAGAVAGAEKGAAEEQTKPAGMMDKLVRGEAGRSSASSQRTDGSQP